MRSGMVFMTVLGLAAAVATSVPASAQERERQIYSPYPQPAFTQEQISQIEYQQEQQQAGVLRVYPGRELYGNSFGPIPRHPGDYRDAVDRGSWTGGGSVGKPNFTGY